MKKIIVLLLLVVSGAVSSNAKTFYEYVKYGGGVELIVRTETHWIGDDTTYGLRKNGMELIPPKYNNTAARVIDELSLLVFMREDEREVRIYNIKTGKEILHHKGCVDFSYYDLKVEVVNGQKQWQIVEISIPYSYERPVKKIVARFCLENGKVYQLINPKTVYTKKEI